MGPTPEFQKVISEVASDEASREILICRTIELAGAEKDAELVAYFVRLINFHASNPTPEQQIQWQQANPFPRKKAAIDDDQKVYFECSYGPAPKAVPLGGLRLVMFGPVKPDPHSYPEVTRFGDAGMSNWWAEPARSYHGAHHWCELTNYGEDPILRVRLDFGVHVHDQAGKIAYSFIQPSIIRRLEGRGTRFQFYLINDSTKSLAISLPTDVEFQRFGDSQNRRVKLATPLDGKMGLVLPPLPINLRSQG